jgi:hypothetical protein
MNYCYLKIDYTNSKNAVIIKDMFLLKKPLGPKIHKMFEHIDYSQIANKKTLLKVVVSKFICPR